MKHLIHIRPQAKADIEDIAQYIARDNLSAALRFLESTEKTFEHLSQMPLLGKLYSNSNPILQDIRCWPVKQFATYLIFYRSFHDGIEVIRILHSARDIPSIMIELT